MPTIRPQKGPQTSFLSSAADIAIYGGSAGAGKSYALLLEAARHTGHKNYRGVIFRRTNPQITAGGGLWDTSGIIYSAVGAKPNISTKDWTFPSGGKVGFKHLQYESNVYDWQGSELAFCVGRGTLILMGDSTYKAVEDVIVGDVVMTLQGPRSVTLAPPSTSKPAYEMVTAGGFKTIVGEGHHVLSSTGWVCLEGQIPNLSCDVCNTNECEAKSSSEALQQREPQHSCSTQDHEPVQQTLEGSHRPENVASSTDGGNGCEESCDCTSEALQLPVSSCRLVLHEPSLRKLLTNNVPGSHHGVPCHVHAWKGSQGFPSGCPCEPYSCGGQSLRGSTVSRCCTPPPSGAASPILSTHEDGLGTLPKCIQRYDTLEYRHPYTSEVFLSESSVSVSCVAGLRPVGAKEVFDLRVAGSSHYISFGGIVHRNCGFDELCHFTERQFFYLLSRNRSTIGIRPYVRATCNPDAGSWVAGFLSWWIDQETGYAITERSGLLRYFYRKGDDMLWYSSPEEAKEANPDLAEQASPKSVTFISAKLSDNAVLCERDPGYKANLMALSYVERMRLLGDPEKGGNWKATAADGMFQSDWFGHGEPPTAWKSRVRAWDFAATESTDQNDPDYTVGVLMGLDTNDKVWVLDVQRVRYSPGRMKTLVKATAESDGPNVRIVIEQEPGSSGKYMAHEFRDMLSDYSVTIDRPDKRTGDKVARASGYSAAVEKGTVLLGPGAWSKAFLAEHVQFPFGSHDDQVDAAASCWRYLVGRKATLLV